LTRLVAEEGKAQTHKAELSLLEAKIQYEKLRAPSVAAGSEPGNGTHGNDVIPTGGHPAPKTAHSPAEARDR
jgi:hypothetical protein